MNKNILYQSSVIRKAQVSLANRFIVLKFTWFYGTVQIRSPKSSQFSLSGAQGAQMLNIDL